MISRKKTFPLHGILGIIFLILSEILLFRKTEPFYSWFYCFAWWPYILTVDGIIFWRKGNSLIVNRTREFVLMIPWSIFFWLIFEAANLYLKNWYYINLPDFTLERWLGYTLAYGTVLPGLFETTELLETIGLFKTSRARPISFSRGTHIIFILLGFFGLLLSVLSPRYFFPLIWLGLTFLLEPFNYRFGAQSLMRDLEDGTPRKIYLLLLAGFVCGLLWEFWNFWALSKWIYTVPFFDESKGFEMPCLGFLGFPPFAVQVYVMYNFISLFRFGRGWEEATAQLHPEKKTRRLAAILIAILMTAFSILIYQSIDTHTVDSYYSRLKDAYWIEPRYRTTLTKVGIASLDDLVQKTKDRQERVELALRLLVPKEELILWIEKAELAVLKGIGVENLRLLDGVGVTSVPDLASWEPVKLQQRMKEVIQGRPIPSLAKIRIWIREARKQVRSD